MSRFAYEPSDDYVIVGSSHGEYQCDLDGNVISEKLNPNGDHRPGERLRFEWPEDVTQGVCILACIEHHADGTVVPRDEDYMRDVYYERSETDG